jgi:hypothetical protein
MSAEANCPKCGAELVDDRSADPDQFYMRRWACGGMEVRRLTGPAFYNDGAPYCLKAEVEQKSAQLSALTARVAELEGERERLREAFWASHTSFEMIFTPQGFVAVDRKTRRHIGGPCEFAVDAALAALAPPEPHDSKEGK